MFTYKLLNKKGIKTRKYAALSPFLSTHLNNRDHRKMIVIDGGFSTAYQSTTGIAGYTLLYNSYGMQLVAHKHFNSKEDVLLNGTDVLSIKRLVDKELKRKKVRETNIGEKIIQEIEILNSLREYRYMK